MQIFVGGQNELTLVTLLQNCVQLHHYWKKSNVSANRDCLACYTVDSYQSLRIRATRGLFLPVWNWSLQQFASDGLVLLEWRYPTQANLQAKFFDLKVLWYYHKTFNIKHFFLKMQIMSEPPLIFAFHGVVLLHSLIFLVFFEVHLSVNRSKNKRNIYQKVF